MGGMKKFSVTYHFGKGDSVCRIIEAKSSSEALAGAKGGGKKETYTEEFDNKPSVSKYINLDMVLYIEASEYVPEPSRFKMNGKGELEPIERP